MGYYRGDYYRGDTQLPEDLEAATGPLGSFESVFPKTSKAMAAASAAASGRKFTRHELATGIEESGGRHRGPRMNVLNIRAARRAIRRLKGFVKVARKAYNFAGPKSRFKHHHKKRG